MFLHVDVIIESLGKTGSFFCLLFWRDLCAHVGGGHVVDRRPLEGRERSEGLLCSLCVESQFAFSVYFALANLVGNELCH